MQPIFSFDIYMKYLKSEKPCFTTYFTNHVAGMMHRYWEDLFEKDNLNTFDISSSDAFNFALNAFSLGLFVYAVAIESYIVLL